MILSNLPFHPRSRFHHSQCHQPPGLTSVSRIAAHTLGASMLNKPMFRYTPSADYMASQARPLACVLWRYLGTASISYTRRHQPASCPLRSVSHQARAVVCCLGTRTLVLESLAHKVRDGICSMHAFRPWLSSWGQAVHSTASQPLDASGGVQRPPLDRRQARRMCAPIFLCFRFRSLSILARRVAKRSHPSC